MSSTFHYQDVTGLQHQDTTLSRLVHSRVLRKAAWRSALVALTSDKDNKDGAVMFEAPELGGEMLLFASVNGGAAIRVYRRRFGKWWRHAQLDAPEGTTYQNIQALSYKGRSLFTVNSTVEDSDNNDILLLSMDGELELVVSGSSPMRRFDPEALPSGDHLFIYYYDLSTGRMYLSDLVLG